MAVQKKNYSLKYVFIFMLFVQFCFSQSDGTLTFSGFTRDDEEFLPDVTIKVMLGEKIYSETKSDKNGHFAVKLEFNNDYKVYFEKENFMAMYAWIAGAVPEDKAHYRIKYEITIPFYDKGNKRINPKAFEQPFTKLSFDGKNKFIDDEAYMRDFVSNVFAKSEAKPKVVVVNEKLHNIAGKVLHNDENLSPYKLIKVTLMDTSNKEIKTTLTNRYGTFSFSGVGIKSTSKIILSLDIDPESGKASIHKITNEKVAGPESFSKNNLEFLNTDENKLIEKLITENYVPFIAGKLTVEENNENKLFAEKYVYLLNDKGEQIEKTQTNIFGNFLFSKLSPDNNFILAIDESESGLNNNSHLLLYSAKDKKIDKKDTLTKGKFLFRFLANDVNSYNDLLVEDIDIKMDVQGKIVGDNLNNPLGNYKVVLIDKNNKVIDTAETNKDGGFNFKYLPYSNNLLIRFADTTDVTNYSSIIIYDNAGNIVKYISLKNGGHFDYKLLAGDMNLLSHAYVDDPWLNLATKEPAKSQKPVNNMVIIENIYFEFNKAELLAEGKQTLDKAILAMQANPNIKIEISAHSDSKGSDDYNLKLSEKRAQSALNYIVSKGIDKKRVGAKGYGEKKLLNKCANGVECTEDEHAKNRRLEFNISMK